jgi:hypothetical protein
MVVSVELIGPPWLMPNLVWLSSSDSVSLHPLQAQDVHLPPMIARDDGPTIGRNGAGAKTAFATGIV